MPLRQKKTKKNPAVFPLTLPTVIFNTYPKVFIAISGQARLNTGHGHV